MTEAYTLDDSSDDEPIVLLDKPKRNEKFRRPITLEDKQTPFSQSQTKSCEWCDKNVRSRKWANHIATIIHKKNLRRVNNNPIELTDDDLVNESIKKDLDSMQELVNSL